MYMIVFSVCEREQLERPLCDFAGLDPLFEQVCELAEEYGCDVADVEIRLIDSRSWELAVDPPDFG